MRQEQASCKTKATTTTAKKKKKILNGFLDRFQAAVVGGQNGEQCHPVVALDKGGQEERPRDSSETWREGVVGAGGAEG